MDLGLRDSVAVVVGGASGIGAATAEVFAEEGAAVAIWDRSEATQQAANLKQQSGRPVRSLVVDICDESAVMAAVEQTERELGAVHHVVHTAAVGSGRFGFPFTNLSPSDWPRVLEVNVQGTVHVAHAWAPRLVERQSGSIVLLASVAGQIGSPTDPPYSASKAAVINFGQCMARDLAAAGVRVNTVCPGMVKTPLNESVWQAWTARQPEAARQDYEQWAAAKIREVVPLQRWQSARDVADMIVFLCSRRALNVTGQTINVDGGFVMHW